MASSAPPGHCDVAVIVCALDEAPSVAGVIGAVPSTIGPLRTHVLVVDDGSKDRTAEVATNAGATLLRHPTNMGHGRSIRDGIAWAAEHGATYLVLLDADGQHDPAEMPAVLGPVVDDRADLVVGSRLLGRAVETPPFRRIGIAFFSVTTRLLFGIRLSDSSNGYRAMRVADATAMELACEKHAPAEMNLAASLHGLRVMEVPVTVHPRLHGNSRMGGDLRMAVDYTVEMLKAYPRHRRLARRRRNLVEPQVRE